MDYGIFICHSTAGCYFTGSGDKQTVFHFLGLWIGTTIISDWNPNYRISKMISDFFIPLIGNTWNAGMIMLIVSCGGLSI